MSRRTQLVLTLAAASAAGAGTLWAVLGGEEESKAAPPQHQAVRDCSGPRIVSPLAPDWRSRAVHAGPVSLLGTPTDSRVRQPSLKPVSGSGDHARHRPTRMVVRVAGSEQALLSVAPEHRHRAGLAYEPSMLWGEEAQRGLRVADAHRAVLFRACRSNATVHEGAVLVTAPGCVGFDVWLEGRDRPIRRTVAFGVPRC